jgi:hypothetical protein
MRPTTPATTTDSRQAEITHHGAALAIVGTPEEFAGAAASLRGVIIRCRLNAALDMSTVFAPDAALALASLLELLGTQCGFQLRSPEKAPERGGEAR